MARDREVDLARRRLLKQAGIGAGFLAAPGLLAACGSDDDGGDTAAEPAAEPTAAPEETPAASDDLEAMFDGLSGEVIIGSYGGTTEEARKNAFWDPFTERTGVDVVVVDIPGVLGNQMLSGEVPAEWDAFHASPNEYLTGAAANPEPFPMVPEAAYEDLVPTEFKPYSWQSFFIGYVPAMLPGTYEGEQPQTWADFFDVEKFPGDRAWPGVDYSEGVFEVALLADGVAPEDVYPFDYERAKAKIRSIWDHLVFYDTFPASQQLLSSGAAAMGMAPNGLWAGLEREGVPTEIIWSAGPILAQNCMVTIPGAPNLDNVNALAVFCNDGERQAQFALATNYGPPSAAAFDFMTEEQAGNFPTSPGRPSLTYDVSYLGSVEAEKAEQNLDLFAG